MERVDLRKKEIILCKVKRTNRAGLEADAS